MINWGEPVLRHQGGERKKGAKTNYDFSAFCDISGVYGGASITCHKWASMSVTLRRMFGENSTTRIDDVHDGTSNTIAMAETLYTTFQWHLPGVGISGVGTLRRGPGLQRHQQLEFDDGTGHPVTARDNWDPMARRAAIIPAGRTC